VNELSPLILSRKHVELLKTKQNETEFYGGIIIDEMSIQVDLILVKHNSDFKLLGFVDLQM